MLALREIKEDQNLINEIDWGMTPERAVTWYLEWGSGWEMGEDKSRVALKPDVSFYFVVYFWDEAPMVHFIRRDTQGSEELAVIPLPDDLAQGFIEYWGGHKGLYALTPEIEAWLKSELGVGATKH